MKNNSMNKNIKLELTSKEVEVLEIALTEMFNSDSWTWGGHADGVDAIADRAESILKRIETLQLQKKGLFTLNENR